MAYKDPAKAREYQRQWEARNRERRNAYRTEKRKEPQHKLWYRDYVERNRERITETNRRWAKENPEKCRARVKRHRLKHPEKVLAYKKKYAAENAEKIAARARRYHQANPEKCRRWDKARQSRIKASKELHEKRKAAHRDYYRRNAEKRKAQVQAYAKAHPEKVRLWSSITAARRRTNLVGFCLAEQWLARIEYYGWCCAYCHRELDLASVQRDHVKPIFAGGADWASNSAPCCGTCNTRKGTKRWIPRPVWQLKLKES